jgi:mannose-6-phosphate isomerase-like protein (cupin superfamily)
MEKGYAVNIKMETIDNDDFRRVLYTGTFSQLVLMSLQPGEEIGLDVHHDTDQFFRFEDGDGMAIVNQTVYEVEGGDALLIPAGAEYNVINLLSSSLPLRLYTIYSPPHHHDQTVHFTKADETEEYFDDFLNE